MKASQQGWLERPQYKAETADDLRELLTQAELIVGNLRRAGPRAQTLLFLMDAISALMGRLKETGIDLRPEATRLETLERLLLAKDGILVREVGGAGALAAARKLHKPGEELWWWYLDLRVAENQRRAIRRLLIGMGAVAAVLLILGLLYRYVFPPDPTTVAVMERTNKAEQAIQQDDLITALELYREAAQIKPDDADLHVWVSVLAQRLKRSEEAEQAYQVARQILKDEARFLTARARALGMSGALDEALADAEAAITVNPELAEAWFVLGGLFEARGDVAKAIVAFEKTAQLAEKADNPALLVTAKTRMGMLMQAAPSMIGPTPTSR